MTDDPRKPALHRDWLDWLTGSALPLWRDAGFDPATGLFHERLGRDGQPAPISTLRLMVQMRQIATYCRAYLDGFAPDADRAIACLDRVAAHYHRADGAPGWVFARDAAGVIDPTRDLYAHAFVIYAHAWVYAASRAPAVLARARETADEIELVFGGQHPGYVSAVPQPQAARHQNPHMHLLEAMLAMAETSGERAFLNRAAELVTLALDRLICPHSGTIAENYDAAWRVDQPPRIEPGHQFEWSWLLDEFLRLAPDWHRADQVRAAAERLWQFGMAHGFDAQTGCVIDAVSVAGEAVEPSLRLWPQTEYLRLAWLRQRRGLPIDAAGAAALARTVRARFLPDDCRGGWIDRFDAAGTPQIAWMPASSLYHVYGFARELRES